MALYNEGRFLESPPAGYDGLFEWDFLRPAFPRGIMPMDHDGVVEIKGHFLTFETKDVGAPIPWGQKRTLVARARTGHDTLVLIWGKKLTQPKHWRWCRLVPNSGGRLYASPLRPASINLICSFARAWACAADKSRSQDLLYLQLLRWSNAEQTRAAQAIASGETLKFSTDGRGVR